MNSTFDPEVEAGAIALCWAARPAVIFPKLSDQTAQHKRDWWAAQSNNDREGYRYKASIVLEAVDELKELAHAAE